MNAGGGFVCTAGDEKKANDKGEDRPNGHGVKIAREGWAGKGFAVVGLAVKENRGRDSLGRHRPRLSHTRKFYHNRLSSYEYRSGWEDLSKARSFSEESAAGVAEFH